MCVSALAATYLIYMSKVRHHRVPCRLLKICIVWTSLKMFCWEIWYDLPATMISDSTLLMRNTSMVLDVTRNSIVYEPLASSNKYLKSESNFFDCLGFKA